MLDAYGLAACAPVHISLTDTLFPAARHFCFRSLASQLTDTADIVNAAGEPIPGVDFDHFVRVLKWVTPAGDAAADEMTLETHLYVDHDGRAGYVLRDAVVRDPANDGPSAGDAGGANPEPGAKGTARAKGRRRAMSWQDAVFFVLFICRTGMDIIDAAPLFHVQYSTACRYFKVYLLALSFWLADELAYPQADRIAETTPPAFKAAFKGRNMQSTFDAHEQPTEMPSDPVLYRTLWSHYKHSTTAKGLGECIPCGAIVGAYPLVGGSCSDVELTQTCGALLRMLPGWSSLADKGFLMHADFAEVLHELITPVKKVRGAKTFSADDMVQTSVVAKYRIHVERAFRRAQEWKILHRTIKISQMPIFSSVWFVCCMMTNFEPQLIRDGANERVSLYEMVWGDRD